MDKFINQIVCGDAVNVLKDLPDQCIHCVVTSPPYFGLRSYLDKDHPDKNLEVGNEETPEQYVERLVELFWEVKRVLRDDGTLWLNLGDSYAANRTKQVSPTKWKTLPQGQSAHVPNGLKPKDLLGIPFRVAFALQADGWYWRSTIPWIKANALPESVKDRPTSGIEYVFMFSKSKKYYYDYIGVQRPYAESSIQRVNQPNFDAQSGGDKDYGNGTNTSRSARKALENFATKIKFGGNRAEQYGNAVYSGKTWTAKDGRRYRNTDAFYDSLSDLIDETESYLNHLKGIKENRGVVLNEDGEIIALDITTKPSKMSHYAVFPSSLIESFILAGCPSQVCAKCGKPFKRSLETVGKRQTQNGPGTSKKREVAAGRHGNTSALITGYQSVVRSVGVIQDCDCDYSIRPGIVYDPFMGSGTTALVAQELGRWYFGTDINAEYVKIAQNRLLESSGWA